MTKVYTLYVDENGNPIVTQGDDNISIKIAGQQGVVITEQEALAIMDQQLNN